MCYDVVMYIHDMYDMYRSMRLLPWYTTGRMAPGMQSVLCKSARQDEAQQKTPENKVITTGVKDSVRPGTMSREIESILVPSK